MKIVVIGTGYVGLVQGVALAELGNEVTCIDVDEDKIAKLKEGISPIYEPGIEELIKKNLKQGRITFETSLKRYLNKSDIVFIAVGTPSDENGKADLKYIIAAAEEIGKNIKKPLVIVNKSTVPIGTGEMVKSTIKKHYKGSFDVISNPEFLREGSAIDDFFHPDRVVIGCNGDREAAEKVAEVYKVLTCPIVITNLETAEMIKYASNSYLATQISFINSIANICEKVGADVADVSRGMKLDKRIGERAFLSAGIGYGGSCFPKDVSAMVEIAKETGEDFRILEEVEAVNKSQRQRFVKKIVEKLGKLKGKRIAIWGVAFKAKTDDIREAPAITIMEALIDLGAEVLAYDPVAVENASKIIPDAIYVNRPTDACKRADALLIVTDWDEFKQVNLDELGNSMKSKVIFDGRNIYNPEDAKKAGFTYFGIGR
ncbi:MAG: UDP-glucose/GDP-mannose dehydrogenase family protein [Patescibacteria group bacterium]